MTPRRIAVVGSVNMDLVLRAPRMPQVGETLLGTSFCQVPGGKGANQAVAAARQGALVSMIGRVGADAFGLALRAALAADGIALDLLGTSADAPSGVAAIVVDNDGNNSIVLAPGANMQLGVADIDAARAAICAGELLVCQLEVPLAVVSHAIGLARQAGRAVLFNPAPVSPLPPGLLAQVDYLVVNETEAAQLTGIVPDGERAARRAALALLAQGAGAVLLTLGAQGVLVAVDGCVHAIGAVRVRAVDSTAAGDTFVGALAVALLDGLDPVGAAMRAQYAAALSVTRHGAQSAIPTRAEVDAFRAAHGDGAADTAQG